MKKGIHPKLKHITVTCACKNQFRLLSSLESDSQKVETCPNCHSFYTGIQNLDLMTGRGGRFKNKHPNFRLVNSKEDTVSSSS